MSAEPLEQEEQAPAKSGWFARLREGLSKSSSKLSDGITSIFTKEKLDGEALDHLEELLIQTDIGAATAARLASELGKERFEKGATPEIVKAFLAEKIAAILQPVARPLEVDAQRKPQVVMVVGVNGNGKTTTIGKMAYMLKSGGWSLILAAADTFRAAAGEQLMKWGDKTGFPVVSGAENIDPSSVAYRALEEAKQKNIDVLVIDTAGRLHNKNNLMEELAKMIRVIRKLDESAPHDVLLVLDATTGQNALAQVEAFKNMVNVTGLVVTKLDGTAKGGVVVALAEKFKLPIHAVGVGEGLHDLRDFDATQFARNLVGLKD